MDSIVLKSLPGLGKPSSSDPLNASDKELRATLLRIEKRFDKIFEAPLPNIKQTEKAKDCS